MPFDPNTRIFRPDFQADTQLPSWIPMGQEQPDQSAGGSSFVDMLKKRMGGGAAAGAGGKGDMPMGGTAGKAGGGEGGGMSSL